MQRLQSLLLTLIVPLAGLTLLFCFSALSASGPTVLSPPDISDARQRKPAAYNHYRVVLLGCQYGNYERCRRDLRRTRTGPEAALSRKRMREAVRLYNQVADDTDPSAFALTPLPRHLRSE